MGRKVTQDEIDEWMKFRGKGYSFRKIGEETGWSEETIRKYVRGEEEKEEKERDKKESTKGGKLAAKAFGLFDDGYKPTKVMQELEIDPDTIRELYEQYQALEEIYPPRVVDLVKQLDNLRKEVDRLEGFCASNLTDEWECSRCGTKGKVAVLFKCTACDRESWGGYYSE